MLHGLAGVSFHLFSLVPVCLLRAPPPLLKAVVLCLFPPCNSEYHSFPFLLELNDPYQVLCNWMQRFPVFRLPLHLCLLLEGQSPKDWYGLRLPWIAMSLHEMSGGQLHTALCVCARALHQSRVVSLGSHAVSVCTSAVTPEYLTPESVPGRSSPVLCFTTKPSPNRNKRQKE